MSLRLTLISLLVSTFVCSGARADDAPATRAFAVATAAPKHGVEADLSLGVIGAAYEEVIGKFLSLQISAHYYKPWYSSATAWGLGGELRPYFFFTGTAPGGAYLSPFLRLECMLGNAATPCGPNLAYAAGATVGYSLVVRRALALRLGVGLQYQSFQFEPGAAAATAQAANVRGTFPAADISVGYFW